MKTYHGQFMGRLVADLGDDGRTVTLTEPFGYVDPTGVEWRVAAGTTVAGESIPDFIRPLMDGPDEARYRKALVIHDAACVDKDRGWERAHEAFFHALRAAKVGGTHARLLYAAAYHFGPRWPSPVTGDAPAGVEWSPVAPQQVWMTAADFEKLAARIETRAKTENPMSLKEIRAFRPAGAALG